MCNKPTRHSLLIGIQLAELHLQQGLFSIKLQCCFSPQLAFITLRSKTYWLYSLLLIFLQIGIVSNIFQKYFKVFAKVFKNLSFCSTM